MKIINSCINNFSAKKSSQKGQKESLKLFFVQLTQKGKQKLSQCLSPRKQQLSTRLAYLHRIKFSAKQLVLANPPPHNCYLLLSATWHSPNSSKNLLFFHINPQKQKHQLQHLLLLTEWCILSPQQKIFMSSIFSGLFS